MMKMLLVVLVVLALPQAVSLYTVCSAGTYCTTNLDGSCTHSYMCGPISQNKHCTTIDNNTGLPVVTAAKGRKPPQTITPFSCECR